MTVQESISLVLTFDSTCNLCISLEKPERLPMAYGCFATRDKMTHLEAAHVTCSSSISVFKNSSA